LSSSRAPPSSSLPPCRHSLAGMASVSRIGGIFFIFGRGLHRWFPRRSTSPWPPVPFTLLPVSSSVPRWPPFSSSFPS
jgi:hypothetical protein